MVDSGWSCTACTLVNPINTAVCSACGAKNDLALHDGEIQQASPTASPRKAMQRQQSINSESRRIRDEKQAKEQWINIVQYCKHVCVTVIDNRGLST